MDDVERGIFFLEDYALNIAPNSDSDDQIVSETWLINMIESNTSGSFEKYEILFSTVDEIRGQDHAVFNFITSGLHSGEKQIIMFNCGSFWCVFKITYTEVDGIITCTLVMPSGHTMPYPDDKEEVMSALENMIVQANLSIMGGWNDLS